MIQFDPYAIGRKTTPGADPFKKPTDPVASPTYKRKRPTNVSDDEEDHLMGLLLGIAYLEGNE